MMHKIDSFHPFPPEVDGDMTGAYYERSVNDGATSLYVIIRPRRYLTERDVQLIESGQLSIEDLHPEVRRLGRVPRPDTLWLYELESFEVDREHHEDQETFNDHAKNYAAKVFDDFGDLIEYCKQTFQISGRDFKKRSATHYPER
jgi:hypothetical protein